MSDQVLNAVLEMKQDVGAMNAKVDLMLEWAKTHSAEDRAAHGRITALETTNSVAAGKRSILQAAGVMVGSVVTMAAQAAIAFYKAHH